MRERPLISSSIFLQLAALRYFTQPSVPNVLTVDFQSWRRWFAGIARGAGNTDWAVAAALGHDTSGLKGSFTMGRTITPVL